MARETITNNAPPPLHEYSYQVHRRIEESLAKLTTAITVARPKEPPDQQPVATPRRSWPLPPSVTKSPLGIKPWAVPRLHLEPPRFDGENAPDWICRIQKYYNHHYTPLDDRLYLAQYLFDHPASDWREYWVENNKGKGWDDFLLAVKQRFDPDLYDYVGRLATLRQTSTVEAYQASFKSLLQKASHIGEATLSSLFIAGLKSPLKQIVLMRRPSTLKETFAIAQQLEQRQPNYTTAFPVMNQEPNRPPPQQNEEVTQEVFAPKFSEEAVSCVVDKNMLDVLPSNEFMDSSFGNKLEVELVENEVVVSIDYILNSSRVPDVKNAWSDYEESRKKIHTSSLNLEVQSPMLLADPELFAEILHTGNDDTGLPCRTVDSTSSFKMLRNCVADPDDDSIDVSNVVRRRYYPSYYTIYLEDTSEYKLHEDEYGKEYVWCVAVSNRWGVFFKIRLFKMNWDPGLLCAEFSWSHYGSGYKSFGEVFNATLELPRSQLCKLTESQHSDSTWFVDKAKLHGVGSADCFGLLEVQLHANFAK